MHLDKDTEACDRCGMTLHTALVRFHKCHGTNMFSRPANITESEWNEALMRGLGAQQVVKGKSPTPGTVDMASFEKMVSEMLGARVKKATERVSTESLVQYYSDVAGAAEQKHKKDFRLVAAAVAIAVLLVVVGVLLLQR